MLRIGLRRFHGAAIPEPGRLGATVAHMPTVGVRELRQHLSRYLEQVKNGTSFAVTERGREVARLTPSGPADSALARLAAERGATLPTGSLLELGPPTSGPARGRPSGDVLDELRQDRL